MRGSVGNPMLAMQQQQSPFGGSNDNQAYPQQQQQQQFYNNNDQLNLPTDATDYNYNNTWQGQRNEGGDDDSYYQDDNDDHDYSNYGGSVSAPSQANQSHYSYNNNNNNNNPRNPPYGYQGSGYRDYYENETKDAGGFESTHNPMTAMNTANGGYRGRSGSNGTMNTGPMGVNPMLSPRDRSMSPPRSAGGNTTNVNSTNDDISRLSSRIASKVPGNRRKMSMKERRAQGLVNAAVNDDNGQGNMPGLMRRASQIS